MAERNLISHTFRHSVFYLRKLVYAFFFFEYFVVFSFIGAPCNAFGFVVVFVSFDNIQIKTDGKLGVRPSTCKQIARDFRLVHVQNIRQADNLSFRRRHFSGQTFYADKIVAKTDRRLPMRNFISYKTRRIERTALAVVVFSRRLKNRFFILPSHRPIDPPAEFQFF